VNFLAHFGALSARIFMIPTGRRSFPASREMIFCTQRTKVRQKVHYLTYPGCAGFRYAAFALDQGFRVFAFQHHNMCIYNSLIGIQLCRIESEQVFVSGRTQFSVCFAP